jgi:hypothetical protein
LPVSFIGQLLLGAGRVEATVKRLGFAPAWVYQRVRVLRFVDGTLEGEEDLSEAMATMRAQYTDQGVMEAVPASRRSDLGWVVNSFLQQL